MSDIYIAKRSGGGSKYGAKYALLKIKYTKGLYCTAERVSESGVILEQLIAPDTSGVWACGVSNPGTWVIKLWDTIGYLGSTGYVASRTMEVANGTYTDVLVSRGGFAFAVFTSTSGLIGGYELKKSSEVVFPDKTISSSRYGCISQSNVSTSGSYWCITPAIDVTDFDEVDVRYYSRGGVSSEYPLCVGLSKTELATETYTQRNFDAETVLNRGTTSATNYLNISGLTGKYFLAASGGGNISIEKIVLDRSVTT